MTMGKLVKITSGGQVSIPAAARKRWRTSRVVAEDHGDHVVLRPAPDDPVAAASGAFSDEIGRGPSAVDAVREERAEEAGRTGH